jgi:uncharacterized protein with NAD-binding domain and iron-sulfur cluster
MPVERARRLWSPAILAADPNLGAMWRLDTAWMNGMKFFLRRSTPIINGAVVCVDSPWLVAGVSQAQFWPVDFASTYGDGEVRDCLSLVISRWTAPGVLYGKPGNECSPQEVANEIWEQLKRHLNKPGRTPVLTDDLVHSWNIDPGMVVRHGHVVSEDPLVLPAVGQLPDRPDVTTALPNLLLAGDYLRSGWEVANMETASYNARRAANAILEQSGSRESPAQVIEPPRPPEWEPLKQIDEQRWKTGQPNLFDTDMTPDQLKSRLGQLIGVPLP